TRDDRCLQRYNSRLPACLLSEAIRREGQRNTYRSAGRCSRRRCASARRPGPHSRPTERSFVTETRQDPDLRRLGADVQSITDALIAQAATEGGQLSPDDVGDRLESTD